MGTLNLDEFTLERSTPVQGNGPGCGVRSQPVVDTQAALPEVHAGGLSAYHRRCLGKRVGECSETLALAVCALCEAKQWEPRDVDLQAVCGLLQAAHGLSDLAHALCREAVPGPGADTCRTAS